MSDQNKQQGPLEFLAIVFIGVTISVTLVSALLSPIDQIVTIIYLISPFLPYYFAVGFILAFLCVFVSPRRGSFGLEFIILVIIFGWLPILILIAFSALVIMFKMLRGADSDRKDKDGDDQ